MKVSKEILVECLGACLESRRGAEVYNSSLENKEVFGRENVQGIMGTKDDTFVIAFRGSDEFKDWVFNFMTAKKCIPYGNANSAIRVHEGWLESYKEIRIYLQHVIRMKKPKKIVVAGQSFGAAVATLCAVDLQYNFSQIQIACVPFGSPKVGNKEFIESFNKRVPDTYRYVYGRDLVPFFPFFGYKAVSFMKKYGPKRNKIFLPSIAQHIISVEQVSALKSHLGVE